MTAIVGQHVRFTDMDWARNTMWDKGKEGQECEGGRENLIKAGEEGRG